jgi:murein DD-endopeptidase MepM/ murein hydrolase activator NlpD
MSLHRGTTVLAITLLSVVLAIGCSSPRFASGEPPDPGSRTAQEKEESTAPTAAASRGDAPQTTALKVSVIHKPLYAKGSDGKVHLEYDLVSTSVFPVPVTLTKVEVRASDGRRLLTLEGDALEARTQPLGSSQPPTREVPASGSLNTLVDIKVAPDKVPEQVTNRITYELPPDAPEILEAIIGTHTIKGPMLKVPRRPATVIAPPLSGEGWWNGNGCCDTTPHRSFRIAVDGERFVTPETFAIDWVQVGQVTVDGEQINRTFEGDGTQNEQYFAFGANVRSATDGEVVEVRDGLPNETPNTDPVNVHLPLDVGGNHVVVRVSPGVYAFYGHLQPGSIVVQEGDRVETGQLLGKLGSSGNSTQPHLHFDLSDGPDPLTSNSLPHVFDRYTWAGSVDVARSTAENLIIEGTPRTERKTYPLFPSVVYFR